MDLGHLALVDCSQRVDLHKVLVVDTCCKDEQVLTSCQEGERRAGGGQFAEVHQCRQFASGVVGVQLVCILMDRDKVVQ